MNKIAWKSRKKGQKSVETSSKIVTLSYSLQNKELGITYRKTKKKK